MPHRRIAACVVGAALLGAGSVRADEGTSQSQVLAESLFDQSVALMKAGDYAAACPKLAESQRLDPAPGTLLYLGDCYERTGRVATAWATFREAAAVAQAAKQVARAELARTRATGLEPKLPKLRLGATSDPKVTRIALDGTPIGPALWSSELPVDPGEHRVAVTYGDRGTREVSVQIAIGEAVAVPMPPIDDATSAPPPAPVREEPPPVRSRPWQRPLALGVAGAGVVGLGLGAAFGLTSFGKWSDAEPKCPNDRCSAEGFALTQDARSAATVSTIAFTAGAVLVAAGVALYLLAPKSASAASRDPLLRGSF